MTHLGSTTLSQAPALASAEQTRSGGAEEGIRLSSSSLVPLVFLALLLVTVAWVYQDATTHAEAGQPVLLWSASLRVETPATWAAVSLVLWVVFFPLYLRARQGPV